MTVYFIYKHGGLFHPFLYAITDDKKLKNSFIKERNKSMFMVKEKKMTEDEFNYVRLQHSGYILGRRGFETKSPSPNLNSSSVIYLTATFQEELSLIEKEDTIYMHLGRFTDDCAIYFKRNILSALNTLHYFEIYKFINAVNSQYAYFVQGVPMPSFENYKIDMFELFLYLYGDSLDREGLIKDA